MKFDDEICKDVSCHECPFNKGEDGCLLAKRLDEIDITPESCEEHTETNSCDCERTETHDWIPVTERLPEKPFGCLVTVMDTEPMTMEEFENLLPYFVGYDGEQWNDWEGEQCPFEVLAWIPLPEPYKEGQDD